MSAVPSIKGMSLKSLTEKFRKILADGTATREELARRLGPEDLALIDGPIIPGDWYDIRILDRMLRLLRDLLGHGDDAWLVRRGAEVAEELMAAGFYQQLKYLARLRVNDESSARERHAAFGTDLRLLTTLSATFYNFTSWTPREDPDHADRYVLDVSGARDFPETVCWTNLGFINRMSSEGGIGGRDALWTWKRERPDLVVFRMRRAP
jgi:hypothetical protein